MKTYLIAIDQSTSATKMLLVDRQGRIAAREALAHRQYYPQPGWVEHDAEEIWANVSAGLERLTARAGLENIEAIAISNQRETSVIWDCRTGRPLRRAIVWQDVRAQALCAGLAAHAGDVQAATGLTLSPYYPAAKLAHALREMPRSESVRVGTIDSWLMYKLGGVHKTDVTNAARTQLMNLEACAWDADMLELFGIPRWMLPEEILPSDSVFCSWQGIPVLGVMGDSHAALYGQDCRAEGTAKATYGTGSSVMLNTGAQIRRVKGLQACVGFCDREGVRYALEGNVTCSGDTLVFLRDIGLFEGADEIERLAAEAQDSGGVQLIPAFSGLGAPYFRSGARASLCGMSRGTTRGEIAYAALMSIAQQNADILEAMGGVKRLCVDGGATKNRLLIQMQADLLGCEVLRSENSEMSPMGAALMAGTATGFFSKNMSIYGEREAFLPRREAQERQSLRGAWKKAVESIVEI